MGDRFSILVKSGTDVSNIEFIFDYLDSEPRTVLFYRSPLTFEKRAGGFCRVVFVVEVYRSKPCCVDCYTDAVHHRISPTIRERKVKSRNMR